MSGIYGFIQLNPQQVAAEARLRKLGEQNVCYGASGNSSVSGQTWGMGCALDHVSACPVDRALWIRDGKYAVIDALIYNRDELIEILKGNEGWSDEELLIRWIEERGPESLALVNGDFAGAIYDSTDETLLLFRDHLGVRPLYFYRDGDVFAFSTDYRGLIAMPGADRSINDEYFYELAMGYAGLSVDRTDFNRVFCVKPGSYMKIGKSGGAFTTAEALYWEPGKAKIRLRGEQAYFDEFRRLITDSVNRRVSAVSGRIGAELSGGLDSGLIDLLIGRTGREGLFVSWSKDTDTLPMQEEDERRTVEEISNLTQIPFMYLPEVSEEDVNREYEYLPMPFMNTAVIGQTSGLLSGHGVSVCFTGHGGDEGVSHRNNVLELFHHHEYAAFLREVWLTTRKRKLRPVRFLLYLIRLLFVTYPKLRKPWIQQTITSSLLSPSFAEEWKDKVTPQTLTFSYDPLTYVKTGGSRGRLDNAAVQGAANGVRYIFPYMDYRVMDFALSIPRRLHCHNGRNRYIMREAFRDILPASLYNINYKDFPSLRNTPPDPAIATKMLEWARTLRGKLDDAYWKRYLDLDRIDCKLAESPETDVHSDAFDKYCRDMHELGYLFQTCGRYQRLIDGTSLDCTKQIIHDA